MGKKERLRQYFAFLNRMTLSPICKKDKYVPTEHSFNAFKGLKASLVLRRKPKQKNIDKSKSCPTPTNKDGKPKE